MSRDAEAMAAAQARREVLVAALKLRVAEAGLDWAAARYSLSIDIDGCSSWRRSDRRLRVKVTAFGDKTKQFPEPTAGFDVPKIAEVVIAAMRSRLEAHEFRLRCRALGAASQARANRINAALRHALSSGHVRYIRAEAVEEAGKVLLRGIDGAYDEQIAEQVIAAVLMVLNPESKGRTSEPCRCCDGTGRCAATACPGD